LALPLTGHQAVTGAWETYYGVAGIAVHPLAGLDVTSQYLLVRRAHVAAVVHVAFPVHLGMRGRRTGLDPSRDVGARGMGRQDVLDLLRTWRAWNSR
jgi:hypothetical protein